MIFYNNKKLKVGVTELVFQWGGGGTQEWATRVQVEQKFSVFGSEPILSLDPGQSA